MQRKIARRRVDGVVLLDKPSGMTSNAALQRVRGLLNAAKAGHTGTLDPMATGLLPLAFGEATKFSQSLLDADKSYDATIHLGVHTDTGDAEGQVLETRSVDCDEARVRAALTGFVGEISQLPPMYSALKRDGKPLYEYARAGIELERTERKITVYTLEVRALRLPLVEISIRVSKGTYIRSLAMDLGASLGCGGHLSALRRTAVAGFEIAQAQALDQLEPVVAHDFPDWLLPSDTLVNTLPLRQLTAQEEFAILQGRVLLAEDCAPGLWRLYGASGFLGVGVVDEHACLRAKRLINTSTTAHPVV